MTHDYSNYQYELEFRKSGGGLIHHEPPDVLTGIAIYAAERNGDVVTLTLADHYSRPLGSPLRLRLLPLDRLGFLADTTGDKLFCARFEVRVASQQSDQNGEGAGRRMSATSSRQANAPAAAARKPSI